MYGNLKVSTGYNVPNRGDSPELWEIRLGKCVNMLV